VRTSRPYFRDPIAHRVRRGILITRPAWRCFPKYQVKNIRLGVQTIIAPSAIAWRVLISESPMAVASSRKPGSPAAPQADRFRGQPPERHHRRDGRDKLLFLRRRDVEATNNESERALRPSVIFRRVTSGFRSEWGAKVYADLPRESCSTHDAWNSAAASASAPQLLLLVTRLGGLAGSGLMARAGTFAIIAASCTENGGDGGDAGTDAPVRAGSLRFMIESPSASATVSPSRRPHRKSRTTAQDRLCGQPTSA
jgi:hypothetical protein